MNFSSIHDNPIVFLTWVTAIGMILSLIEATLKIKIENYNNINTKPNNFSVLKIKINEVDLLKLEKPFHKRYIWKKIDNWKCIEVNP